MRVRVWLTALCLACPLALFSHADEVELLSTPSPVQSRTLAPGLLPPADTSAELSARLQGLERLQNELGRYDPALTEAHDQLAVFYRQQGDFRQAARHYREAFQLTRINSGLYSEAQLPYATSLIESQLEAGDWQQADTMFQLRYSLKSRLYPPADPRFAEAVAELGDWQVRTLRENLLNEGYRELDLKAQALDDFYREAIENVTRQPGSTDVALVPLYQSKSHADLAIAKTLANTPFQFFPGTVNPYTYQSVCEPGARGRDGGCTSVRQNNPLYPESQRSSKRNLVFRHVRELGNTLESLDRIMASHPDELASRRDSLDRDLLRLKSEFDEFRTADLTACCAKRSPLALRNQ